MMNCVPAHVGPRPSINMNTNKKWKGVKKIEHPDIGLNVKRLHGYHYQDTYIGVYRWIEM